MANSDRRSRVESERQFRSDCLETFKFNHDFWNFLLLSIKYLIAASNKQFMKCTMHSKQELSDRKILQIQDYF